MTLPKVTISIPIRDRGWVLPWTLLALLHQDYPEELLAFRFILHNCTDDSKEQVEEFASVNNLLYRYIDIQEVHDDTPPDGRTSHERNRTANDPRHAQARLKNQLIEALDEDEWFFFCDSDVLLHPDCIRHLVMAKKDIVGGLTHVVPNRTIFNYFPRNPFPGMPYQRNDLPPPRHLTEVGLVCGILLYSPKAWKQCEFRFIGVGEDEGAMRDAEQAGIPIWLEPHAIGEHVMGFEHLAEGVGRWYSWVRK